MKRKALLIVGALLLSVLIVALQIPASLLVSPLQQQLPGLHLYGVSGSLWNGHVRTLQWQQESVHNMDWQLSPWALLLARAQLQLHVADAQQLHLDGQLTASWSGKLQARDLRLSLPASRLDALFALPGAQLQGELNLNLQSLAYHAGEWQDTQGELQWTEAAVNTIFGREELGAYSAKLGDEDKALQATLHDDAGVLDLQGQIRVDAQMLDLQLSVKRELKESLQRFFSQFAQDDGTRFHYQLQRALPTAAAA